MGPYLDVPQMDSYIETQECTTNVILAIGLMVLVQHSALGLISGIQAKYQDVLKVSNSEF